MACERGRKKGVVAHLREVMIRRLLNTQLGMRALARVRPPVVPVARIAFNVQPVFASWGGGNQWLLQMARYLCYSGYSVRFDLRQEVDCILITHFGLTGKSTISPEELAEYRRRFPRVRVIHRVNDNDVRKKTQGMDDLLARYNAHVDYTVFISEWLRDHHAKTWFRMERPHKAILNGADPSVFHPVGNRTWREGEPFRIVTHHWSDNPMKGFPQYAEIDARIAAGDLPGVELWVLGRWPSDIQWRAAKTLPPAHGSALAAKLREAHAYVTASLHEPGGMHFIEGLQCGLPLAFHEDGGGIVELARKYGVGFRDDPAAAVRELQQRYTTLRGQVLAAPPSGDRMCIEYRDLIQGVLAAV